MTDADDRREAKLREYIETIDYGVTQPDLAFVLRRLNEARAAGDRRIADLLAANNALLERARAAEDELRWRPIETAPKDGSKILLLSVENEREVGYWNPNGDSWADEDGNPCPAGCGTIQVTGSWFAGGGWFQPNEVKCWLPLPEPPRD